MDSLPEQPRRGFRGTLAARIGPRLVRVPEAQRAELAQSIAAATVRACPLALRDWGEAAAQISTKMDVQFEHQKKEAAAVRSSISRLANALGEPGFAEALLMGPLAQVSREEAATRAELLENAGEKGEAATRSISRSRRSSDALDSPPSRTVMTSRPLGC